jgi:hypothetical protein
MGLETPGHTMRQVNAIAHANNIHVRLVGASKNLVPHKTTDQVALNASVLHGGGDLPDQRFFQGSAPDIHAAKV